MSLSFVIFPKWAKSFLAQSKVFLATSSYGSSFWVPQSTNLLLTSCCFPNPLVLRCVNGRLRFLVLFDFPPFLSWAILVFTLSVLHVLGISSLWQSLGSRPNFSTRLFFGLLILAGWAFTSWALKPALLWILGFKSLGPMLWFFEPQQNLKTLAWTENQRKDKKIRAIWKPKTYASQSVKKGAELWGSVSIYRG